MRKPIEFFATRSDVLAVLHDVESHGAIKYVLTGLRPQPDLQTFDAGDALPGLGIVVAGDAVQAPRYLVVAADAPVRIRPVRQRRGGVMYAIDAQANPDSVSFSPGGRFEHVALIAGRVSPALQDGATPILFERFAHAIRHRFAVVGAYRVGDEANELRRTGLRLTANVRSPRKYDLAD